MDLSLTQSLRTNIVKQTLVGFKFEQKIIVKNNPRCQRHFFCLFSFFLAESLGDAVLFLYPNESPGVHAALSIVANILNSRRVAGKLQYKNECFAINLNGWSWALMVIKGAIKIYLDY